MTMRRACEEEFVHDGDDVVLVQPSDAVQRVCLHQSLGRVAGATLQQGLHPRPDHALHLAHPLQQAAAVKILHNLTQSYTNGKSQHDSWFQDDHTLDHI